MSSAQIVVQDVVVATMGPAAPAVAFRTGAWKRSRAAARCRRYLRLFVWSSASLRVPASFAGSSLAQKCM